MDIRGLDFKVNFAKPMGENVKQMIRKACSEQFALVTDDYFNRSTCAVMQKGLVNFFLDVTYASHKEWDWMEPQTIIDLVNDKLIMNPDGSISANKGYRLTDGIKPKEEPAEPATAKFDDDRNTIFKILSEHPLETQNNLLAEVKKMVVNHRETQINEHNVQSKAIDASIIDLKNKLDLSNRHNQ